MRIPLSFPLSPMPDLSASHKNFDQNTQLDSKRRVRREVDVFESSFFHKFSDGLDLVDGVLSIRMHVVSIHIFCGEGPVMRPRRVINKGGKIALKSFPQIRLYLGTIGRAIELAAKCIALSGAIRIFRGTT